MTQEIIPNQFDQSLQQELQSAADTWRLPYWDWAAQKPDWHDKANTSKFGPNVPEIITLQKVPVRGKTGGMVFVDNPVWKFTLAAGDNMGNHGIPSLEGEPVSEPHARSSSLLLNGVSSKPPRLLSGGHRLINPTIAILRQNSWREKTRTLTLSRAISVAIVTISATPFRKPSTA
jgi:hypothetical protein